MVIDMLAYLSFCLILAFLIMTLFVDQSWRRLIWNNKSRIFRIVKQGDKYYPEKRFLWFFFVRIKDSYSDYVRFWSKEDAWDYIQKFLQDFKEEQLTKRELIDFSNLKGKEGKKYEKETDTF